MLVISMSDFLGNPAQYVERARHVPVQIEDMGEKPVTLSVRRPGIFAAIANLFKPKFVSTVTAIDLQRTRFLAEI